jgi:bifunctional DNA-binding transcriptional regulator/antitoxin component of YhaV-PrlF toxin-antitoxin module
MSTSTEVSAFNLGAQGRFVLPVAVRRAANLSEGATLVARAEGEGRIVIETREAITKRVWANAPTPMGLNTIADVRAMRNEDNEISQTNYTRRSKVTSEKATDEAGAILLKRLGR